VDVGGLKLQWAGRSGAADLAGSAALHHLLQNTGVGAEVDGVEVALIGFDCVVAGSDSGYGPHQAASGADARPAAALALVLILSWPWPGPPPAAEGWTGVRPGLPGLPGLPDLGRRGRAGRIPRMGGAERQTQGKSEQKTKFHGNSIQDNSHRREQTGGARGVNTLP